MTKLPKHKVKIVSDFLLLSDLSEFDALMTKAGARIPGKNIDFTHEGKILDVDGICYHLLIGDIVRYGNKLDIKIVERENEKLVIEASSLKDGTDDPYITSFSVNLLPALNLLVSLVYNIIKRLENPLADMQEVI